MKDILTMNSEASRRRTSVPLFDLALISYLFWATLRDVDILLPNKHLVVYVSVFFSILSIINRCPLNKMSFISYLLLFTSVAVFFRLSHGDVSTLPVVFLIFAAYKVDVDHIVRVFFYTTLVTTFFVFLLSMLGILSNKVFNHRIGTEWFEAYGFGFVMYSFFSFRVMLLTCSFLYLKRNKCSIFLLLVILITVTACYFFTYTRLQLLVSLILVVLYILSYKTNILDFRSWIWKYISWFAYPLTFFFYLIIPFASFVSPSYLELLDEIFSGRISYMVAAFFEYPITMWGNSIEMVGAVQLESVSDEYFYVDSGYAFWILSFGIVFTSFILYAYSRVFYIAYKSQDKYLYIWCLLFAPTNMINDFFTYTCFCPLILFLFARYPASACLQRTRIILKQQ